MKKRNKQLQEMIDYMKELISPESQLTFQLIQCALQKPFSQITQQDYDDNWKEYNKIAKEMLSKKQPSEVGEV